MIYSRYHYAAMLANGKRVLEIGCGSGQGFGMVGGRARFLVGGDIDLTLLVRGREHYGKRFSFAQLTGQALPFRDASFNVVLFFETSYYVPNMDRAFGEVARVLGPDGVVVFVNANPERPDFIPSPFVHRYHSADEFRQALERRGFDVTLEGAYPIASHRARDWIVLSLRKLLHRLALVPPSLRGRAILKRVVLGRLIRLPPELRERFATPAERVPLKRGPAGGWKVIYVTARRRQNLV